jgi:peroxiredoxin
LALEKKYGASGLVVVAPTPEAEEKAKQFKEKYSIDYALLAGAQKAMQAYKVRAFPMMYLVGKDGKVAWSGNFEDASLHKAIEAATGAK